MGLLDSLFDPQTYGGAQGLLSRLMPDLAQIPPSQGFPQQGDTFSQRFQPAVDNPLQQPQSFAQRFQPAADSPLTQMAPSIAVGNNYQMPRFGNTADYTSQQGSQSAALPPNATPTQGQLPSAQQQAQIPQQQTLPSFLDNSGGLGAGLRGFANNMQAGPLGALIGGVGSAFGMQDPTQQNLRAQHQALTQTLIANGETPQAAASKAMIAVMNPDAAKTIIPELFTSKQKYGVISEDPLDGKKYGFIDERNQTVNGQPIGGQGQPAQGGGSMEALKAAQQAGVSGPALYDHMPKGIAPVVKAMVEGRQPLPSTTAMRSPATLALIEAAHTVDPTFDATVWKARNEAGPDWSKGKSAEMVRSANQTLAHVGSLMSAMDDLKNTRFPIANSIGNTVRENLGSGEQGAFRTNAHAVAEEMSKVFKGANLSDAEIRHWEQNLSENMSPAQQRAQIAKLSELLHGSLQALEEKRLTAMGPAAAERMGPLIKPEGQAVLKKIDEWVKGNGGQSSASPTGGIQEGATATNPQTGAKLTYRGGKWQ